MTIDPGTGITSEQMRELAAQATREEAIRVVKYTQENGNLVWRIEGEVPEYFILHTFTSEEDAQSTADYYITEAMNEGETK